MHKLVLFQLSTFTSVLVCFERFGRVYVFICVKKNKEKTKEQLARKKLVFFFYIFSLLGGRVPEVIFVQRAGR